MDEWTYERDWWSNGRGWIRQVVQPDDSVRFVCWVNGHPVLYWFNTLEEAKWAYYNYERKL